MKKHKEKLQKTVKWSKILRGYFFLLFCRYLCHLQIIDF